MIGMISFTCHFDFLSTLEEPNLNYMGMRFQKKPVGLFLPMDTLMSGSLAFSFLDFLNHQYGIRCMYPEEYP